MHAYIYARRRRNRKDRPLAIELRRKLRKNPKVQKSKRCEIAKSNNRIIQKSKSTNTQKIWNIKKIYAALRIICQHTTESNLVQTSKGTSTNVKPRIILPPFLLYGETSILFIFPPSCIMNSINTKFVLRISHLLDIWTFGFLNNSIIRFYYFTSFAYLNFSIFK